MVVAIALATTAFLRATGAQGLAPEESPVLAALAQVGPRVAARPCPPEPQRRAPDPARPRYRMRLDLRPVQGTLDGEVRIRFVPDLATDKLVLRLWPNDVPSEGGGDRLRIGTVRVDGHARPARAKSPTLVEVPLPAPLRAGRAVDIRVPFHLDLPGVENDRLSRAGESARLGSFFPLLPWQPGLGWAEDAPAGLLAEAATSPAADFDVDLAVIPTDLGVLATGREVRPGHWQAVAVRDFGISVGRFSLTKTMARAPHPVEVTIGVQEGFFESTAAYLDQAKLALENLSRRFGPYPGTSFSISIEPGLDGGIEYPHHVMQGPDTVGVVGHEVAHQWFYGLVGNNQAEHPWIDEGLATWSDVTIDSTIDEALEEFVQAPIERDAFGRAGRAVSYWREHSWAYDDAVYVQPVQALSTLGPPALVDCALRLLVAEQAYRIARPEHVFAALERVFPDARRALAPFGLQP